MPGARPAARDDACGDLRTLGGGKASWGPFPDHGALELRKTADYLHHRPGIPGRNHPV